MAPTAIMDRRKWLLRLIYVRLAVFTICVVAETTRRGESSLDMLVLLENRLDADQNKCPLAA